MNRKEYWENVERVRADLPEWPILVSKNLHGIKSECSADVAAQWIADGTHRLATDEETRVFREDIATRRKLAEDEANARRLQLEVIERNLISVSRLSRGELIAPVDTKPKK